MCSLIFVIYIAQITGTEPTSKLIWYQLITLAVKRLAHRRRIHQATFAPEGIKSSFPLDAKGPFAATYIFFVVFAVITHLLDDIIGPVLGEP